MIRHISTYVEGGRTFYICKEIGSGLADGYWAFEDKMLDENGCLARRVNGLEGHHRETLGETIQSVSCQVRFDAMLAAGVDRSEAMRTMYRRELERLGVLQNG